MFLKILRGFNAAVQRQKKEKTGDASAFSTAGARPGLALETKQQPNLE
jgi:hypothetical protein